MLGDLSPTVKPQKGLGDYLSVRSELVRRNLTLAGFARKHGCSLELVRQVISGRCTGQSGTAAKIRVDLIEALK